MVVSRVDPPIYDIEAIRGSVDRLDTQAIDIRSKGAVAGNPAFDNAGAIYSALNELVATGGGEVIIPSVGDFWTSEEIPYAAGTIVKGFGPRRSRLRFSSLTKNGVEMVGADANNKAVQMGVMDLALIGPGASGSGSGIYSKWTSTQIFYERLHVYGWGGHGADVEDSYMASWRDVLFDHNEGDGYHGELNINATLFDHVIALFNGGRGLFIQGGAGNLINNYDGERNVGAGFDLRKVYASRVLNPHLEGNGTDGTSPNAYLHWETGSSDRCEEVVLDGGLYQGRSVTGTGIVVDGANKCLITGSPRFEGHVTRDVEIKSNAARTHLDAYVDPARLLDSSATTIYSGPDNLNFMPRMGPGLHLIPRTSAPSGTPKGSLWTDDTNSVLRFYNGTSQLKVPGVLEGSGSIAATNLAAGATTDITITVTGAATGDTAIITPPLAVNAGIMVGQAWVSAANTVKCRLHNTTAGAVDTTSVTSGWKAKVYKGLA